MDRSSNKFGLRLSALAVDSTHEFTKINTFALDQGTFVVPISLPVSEVAYGTGLTLYTAIGPASVDVGVARLWGQHHGSFQYKAMLGYAIPIGASGEMRIRVGYRHDSSLFAEGADASAVITSGIALELELVANIGQRGGITLMGGGFALPMDEKFLQPMFALGGEYTFIGDNRFPSQEGVIALDRAKKALNELNRLADPVIIDEVAERYIHIPSRLERYVFTFDQALEYLLYPTRAWQAAHLSSFDELYHQARAAAGYAQKYGLSEQQVSAKALLVKIGEDSKEPLNDYLAIKIASVLNKSIPHLIELYCHWSVQLLKDSDTASMIPQLQKQLARSKRTLESLNAHLVQFKEKFNVVATTLEAFHSTVQCILYKQEGCSSRLEGISMEEIEAKLLQKNKYDDSGLDWGF